MKFGNPMMFWILLLIPFLIAFYVWSFRYKKELINQFVTPALSERLLLGVSFIRQKLKVVIVIIAIFFLVLSLIAPKWGFHWEDVKRKGVDIVIALDLSKSMMARCFA
jgi:Ca-activated chloride channel family protein